MTVYTKANTLPFKWQTLAVKEFKRLGLREPTPAECSDAYDVGESPETWAAYADGYSHERVTA